jgi:RNA-directed DNA polymerase
MRIENYHSLYGRLLNYTALYRAMKKVKKAGGAAGIDQQRIADFVENSVSEIRRLLDELRDKSYRPQPVKRVEIPKPDGGVRKLGIPAVRDRIVQQALLDIIQEIYEEDFHPSSYGYRPKRSCHDAINKACLFMRKYEMKHVVDMDLSKCFDTLDHDLIIKFMSKRISDGSILNLVKLFLQSGVMNQGQFEDSEIGSPQGGVISPLIANIYLNEFDQEMKRRNFRIVRYADDILIFSKSRKGAEKCLAKSQRNSRERPQAHCEQKQNAYCSQWQRRQISRCHNLHELYIHTAQKAQGIQGQNQEDNKAQFSRESAKSHQRTEPSTSRFCQLLSHS